VLKRSIPERTGTKAGDSKEATCVNRTMAFCFCQTG